MFVQYFNLLLVFAEVIIFECIKHHSSIEVISMGFMPNNKFTTP